jgi:hypothetical protein
MNKDKKAYHKRYALRNSKQAKIDKENSDAQDHKNGIVYKEAFELMFGYLPSKARVNQTDSYELIRRSGASLNGKQFTY